MRQKTASGANSDNIVIIGAGINGLVAANYLQRAGHKVTLLERKARVGGACTKATLRHKGRAYVYPPGASVLGFMQDFVFRDTGLKKRLSVYSPRHPEIVYYGLGNDPCLAREQDMRSKWNENGDIAGFENDMEKVVSFIRKSYKDAAPPTLAQARRALGPKLVKMWITGSARALLDHYFTSEYTKLFYSLSVTESGPVSLSSPYSALTIPLMASGSVFGGRWGFVKGGLWTLTETLGEINKGLGVNIVCNAETTAVSEDTMTVTYKKNGKNHKLAAGMIVFATDPLTAAKLKKDRALSKKISGQEILGSSGKLVMIFSKPVRWKGDAGRRDSDMAFRFIMPVSSLDEFEQTSNLVKKKKEDFAPGCYQIYCEGAGDRKLGGTRDYDIVSVFFKSLALTKKGRDLPQVRKKVQNDILSQIENKKDLLKTVLLTPKDLNELFYFPGGNIDHTEVCEGQTFFDRTYSASPQKSFYRFGSNPRIFYCGAGSWPCGAVAGTPGYLCAQEIIRKDNAA